MLCCGSFVFILIKKSFIFYNSCCRVQGTVNSSACRFLFSILYKMAGKRAILHRMIGVFLSGYPLYYTYRQPLCSDFLSPKRQRPDKHTEPREAADMSLGNSLFNARRKSGLSQEEVAEKLGVSRQTISKWELEEKHIERDGKRHICVI